MSLKRKEPSRGWEGGEIKVEMQGCLNGDIYRKSHGMQKRMRYAPQYYALDIVLGCGLVIAGWPQDVPFTDLSSVGGGIEALREIRRRWHLPDGDPEKLRFEPASREDYANAARDPESVHPTPQYLPELKARAAAAKARAQALPVESDVYDSRNMRRVGRQSTSTMPEPKAQTQQRQDTKKRRARASDMETRVRKKRQTTGVTSMPFVALEDPITNSNFKLTHSFGGELSDDPIEDASTSK